MIASARRLRILEGLLIATVVGSIVHYADNLLFFEQYPEPPWIDRTMIDAFWLLMTPLAWIGYALIRRGSGRSGTFVVLLYAACNLLTLGHYRYADICSVSLRINAFILIEAAMAVALAVFVLVPQRRRAAA